MAMAVLMTWNVVVCEEAVGRSVVVLAWILCSFACRTIHVWLVRPHDLYARKGRRADGELAQRVLTVV